VIRRWPLSALRTVGALAGSSQSRVQELGLHAAVIRASRGMHRAVLSYQAKRQGLTATAAPVRAVTGHHGLAATVSRIDG